MKRLVKRSKFDSNFNPVPCKIIKLNEHEALVETDTGNQYRRSLAHLKKIEMDSSEGESNQEENAADRSLEEEPDFLGF